LPIRKSSGELQDSNQRQSPGRFRWSAMRREQRRERFVLVDSGQFVAQPQPNAASRESSAGDTSGFLGHWADRLGAQ
jgi:hypothetical protein